MIGLFGAQFKFPGQLSFYKGKVRDVYFFKNVLVAIASDRISAFDYVLPIPIPFKGQVLNQIATHFLEESKDIVPNWLIAAPDPNVSIGYKCEPIKIEIVVRGYLAGHAWREYKDGKRMLCGENMPHNMKESDKFPNPIITPATKADAGHDEDISREDILDSGIISEDVYDTLERYTLRLFHFGSEKAREKGLILVDTKYEFGVYKDQVMLIDEIHTPDSSRYYYLEGYENRQEKGLKQKQLSKEFVREWLMENGFQGRDGDEMPVMTEDFVQEVSNRYIDLYEILLGVPFQKRSYENIDKSIEMSVNKYLKNN